MRSSLLAMLVLAAFAATAARAAEPVADSAKSGAAGAGEKHLLRYQFKAGETLRWEVVQQSDIETTVSGTTQRAKTYSKSVKLWKVMDADDGGFTFQHMVESTAMWHELQGRARVEFDSTTDKVAPEGFEGIAASLGRPLLRVQVNTQGEVLKRTVLQQAPGLMKDEDEEHQMTMPLPKEAIAVGHEWYLPFDIKLPQDGGAVKVIKAREHFRLTGVANGIATISMETQVLSPVRDPALEAQLVQRGGKGFLKFDLAAGRVVGQQVDIDKGVVGFRGAASSIHYVSRFTERLVADAAKTAEKPTTTEVE